MFHDLKGFLCQQRHRLEKITQIMIPNKFPLWHRIKKSQRHRSKELLAAFEVQTEQIICIRWKTLLKMNECVMFVGLCSLTKKPLTPLFSQQFFQTVVPLYAACARLHHVHFPLFNNSSAVLHRQSTSSLTCCRGDTG